MSILVSKEILNAIYSELSSAQKSVQMISAFCKLDALKNLEFHINPCVLEKKILVRFRLSDLISGATDFKILEYCLSNGWKVFIRFDLHAKTYIVDNSRGIIGCANMTASGLELKNYGNYEMASFVKVEKDDIHKIESLFENSIKVTDEIIRIMRMQYEEAKENGKNVESSEWSDDIKNLSKILDCDENSLNNENIFNTLFNWLTCENKEESNQVVEFLNNLDKFNLNDYIKAIKFDELTEYSLRKDEEKLIIISVPFFTGLIKIL